MGYSVKEAVSDKLTNTYPAYYQEMQVQNWTSQPILVTDRFGNREIIAQCLPNQIHANGGYVVCEWRATNGNRLKPGVACNLDKVIPGGRAEISFNEIKRGPVYVKEVDVVLSAVEMEMLAIHPNQQVQFIDKLIDPLDASEIVNNKPTFTITANDPNFTYEELFVYVFGRVISVKVKHVTPIDSPFRKVEPSEVAGVFIYFRQGLDDCGDIPTHVSFENVDNGVPCEAVDGTNLYIATSEEKLRDIIKDRHDWKYDEMRKTLSTTHIISKDVYEKAMKMADEKYDNLKKKHDDEKRALEEERRLSEQKLKNTIEDERQKRVAAETREQEWKDIHNARCEQSENESKTKEQTEKARKEAYLADQERIKRDALTLKIIGTAAVAVISFGLTVWTRTSKK